MEIVQVKMSDIKVPNRSELNEAKIRGVETAYDSLDTQLNSKTDPVSLRRDTFPYEVYTGRHRVYVAYQRGYTSIPATFT